MVKCSSFILSLLYFSVLLNYFGSLLSFVLCIIYFVSTAIINFRCVPHLFPALPLVSIVSVPSRPSSSEFPCVCSPCVYHSKHLPEFPVFCHWFYITWKINIKACFAFYSCVCAHRAIRRSIQLTVVISNNR